jgi:hypothetical protein
MLEALALRYSWLWLVIQPHNSISWTIVNVYQVKVSYVPRL